MNGTNRTYPLIGSLLVAALIWLPGALHAAISTSPTLSSSSHKTNTSSTSSDVAMSWTAASSDKGSGATITYEYLLDGTASYTHAAFASAYASASSSVKGQLSNATSIELTSVADGTFYFHLRAYDSSGISSGTSVINYGPIIIDSAPTLSSTSVISPASGSHASAVSVTINGSKFMSGATVKLVNGARTGGSNPSTSLSDVSLTNVTRVNSNQLTATVPSGTAPGVYDLKVTNGSPNNKSVTSTDAYTSTNNAPTAAAGDDQSTTLSSGSASFTLSSTASSDADSDTLSSSNHTWTLSSAPTGATVTSSGAAWSTSGTKTGSSRSVTVNTAGTYTFGLVVSDGYNNSSSDSVTVTVRAESGGNNIPTANAGSDQVVANGATVTLSGANSSDLDGDTLQSYTWTFTSVPSGSSLATGDTGAITQGSPPAASFTADAIGTFVVSLVVNDGTVNSEADTVNIVVNSAPTANAGADQTVGKGVMATLDGSGSSDAENNTLTYTWSQSSGTAVTLSSTSAQKPTFTPTANGTYVFSLTVNDGYQDSASADTVTITVADAPTAPSAGSDQTVEKTATNQAAVNLAGTNSDSGMTQYKWVFSSVPAASALTSANLANQGAATASTSTATGGLTDSFTPDVAGLYVLSLTVANSSNIWSAADTVNIELNTAPVANAGADASAGVGFTTTLNGSSSADADGDNLTYAWTATAAPTGVTPSNVTITRKSASLPTATFVPGTAGDYTFSLTVSDGNLTSTADTVVITAAEVNFSASPTSIRTHIGAPAITITLTGANDPVWSLDPAYGTLSGSGGTVTYTPSSTALTEGSSQTATITASDTIHGTPISVDIPATIYNPMGLTASGGGSFSTEQTLDKGSSTTFTPSGGTGDYTVTVTPPTGDQTALSPNNDGSSYTFVPGASGVYTLTVSGGVGEDSTITITVPSKVSVDSDQLVVNGEFNDTYLQTLATEFGNNAASAAGVTKPGDSSSTAPRFVIFKDSDGNVLGGQVVHMDTTSLADRTIVSGGASSVLTPGGTVSSFTTALNGSNFTIDLPSSAWAGGSDASNAVANVRAVSSSNSKASYSSNGLIEVDLVIMDNSGNALASDSSNISGVTITIPVTGLATGTTAANFSDSYSVYSGSSVADFEAGTTAEETTNVVYDPSAGTVSVTVDHFSVFGVGDAATSASTGGGGGGGCFIATAAYGSYEAPYVRLLREFRDQFLLTNAAGTWFVEQYYTWSPPMADWLRGHDGWRAVVRIALLPLIAMSWILVEASLFSQIVILLLGVALPFALFGWRRRRTVAGQNA